MFCIEEGVGRMYNNIEKIAKQVEIPQKPRCGTVSDYILFIIFFIVSIICFSSHASDDVIFQLIISIIACVSCLIAVIVLVLTIIKYIRLKKEYIMAQDNELEYRRYKALQFILQNEKNIKENEMFIEWMKKHPKRKKLPHFIETAILRGDSLTIQEYLYYITENRDEYENK